MALFESQEHPEHSFQLRRSQEACRAEQVLQRSRAQQHHPPQRSLEELLLVPAHELQERIIPHFTVVRRILVLAGQMFEVVVITSASLNKGRKRNGFAKHGKSYIISHIIPIIPI